MPLGRQELTAHRLRGRARLRPGKIVFKTLEALPPQDELLDDTIQVVDQGVNSLVR
jgi:hypothetical protein